MTPSIEHLADYVNLLPAGVRDKFNRIYSFDVAAGKLHVPAAMLPLAERYFGSADRVANQTVVSVTNLVTMEQSIFNPLRSLRPQDFTSSSADQRHVRAEEDPFTRPLENTTEEPFGRVRGKHCITAGNVAKIDQHHAVIIFDNPDPLDFSRGEVADYIDTGFNWMMKANQYDPAARYGLFLWNCNNRAGASIAHGHAQAVMGRGSHYAGVESLRRGAAAYREDYGTSYFEDVYEVHQELGLGFDAGDARVTVSLSPLKPHEVMITAKGLSGDLKGAVYRVLSCFRDRMGVTSFNLSVAFPPLGNAEGWVGFPVVARMLSRGRAENRSSDISAMELWGANVVSSDPFEDAAVLRASFD
jgi:hypothetical protein